MCVGRDTKPIIQNMYKCQYIHVNSPHFVENPCIFALLCYGHIILLILRHHWKSNGVYFKSNKDEIMTILEKEALTFAVSLSWDTMIVPVKPHCMSLSLNHKGIYLQVSNKLQYAVHQFKKKVVNISEIQLVWYSVRVR